MSLRPTYLRTYRPNHSLSCTVAHTRDDHAQCSVYMCSARTATVGESPRHCARQPRHEAQPCPVFPDCPSRTKDPKETRKRKREKKKDAASHGASGGRVARRARCVSPPSRRSPARRGRARQGKEVLLRVHVSTPCQMPTIHVSICCPEMNEVFSALPRLHVPSGLFQLPHICMIRIRETGESLMDATPRSRGKMGA